MDAGTYAHGGYKVVVVASILILMKVLMVGGRLLGRRLQKVWLGVDDYGRSFRSSFDPFQNVP